MCTPIWDGSKYQKTDSLWYYLFFVYYAGFLTTVLLLLYRQRKKASSKREKKQADLIFYSILLTFILASGVETVLPSLGFHFLPPLGPIFTLIFATGVGLAISKYRLMKVTPILATDDLLLMMKDFFILFDPEWRVVAVNRHTEESLSFRKDELLRKSIDSLVNPSDLHFFKNPLQMEKREIQLTTKDGEYIPVLGSLSEIRDRSGDLVGYAFIAQDLRDKKKLEEEIVVRKRVEEALLSYQASLEQKIKDRTSDLLMANETLRKEIEERRKAEDYLRESEERYKLLFENAGDAICLLNEKLEFIDLNKRAQEFFGYSKEELLGKRLTDLELIHKEDRERVESSLLSLTSDKVGTRGQVRFLTKNGEKKIGDCTSTIFLDRKKNAPVILTIIKDITRRKKMEEELARARRMEAVGVLAGGIAHDFNNLLAVVMGNLSLAKMSLETTHRAYSKLSDAEKAILKAKELTKKLLLFARTTEGRRKEVDLKQIVEDTAFLVFAGSPVKCELQFPYPIPSILADEDQIRQVINSVMLNAKEAMSGRGILKVKGEAIRIGQKNRFSLEEGDYVKITIQDSGPGISEEVLSKVFDPYFSTKGLGSEKGTGLSLALSYTIVKNHMGHIEIDSKPEGGTVVDIYLPAYRSSEKGTEEKAKTPIKGKILIMDDEEMVREVTAEILNNFGFVVECASSGFEAVQIYKRAFDNGEPFDVVILDLTIQGGMGGKEAFTWLKEIDPNVKAVITSGYAYDPIISSYKEYGFAGALSKPFEVSSLIELIEEITKEKKA